MCCWSVIDTKAPLVSGKPRVVFLGDDYDDCRDWLDTHVAIDKRPDLAVVSPEMQRIFNQ